MNFTYPVKNPTYLALARALRTGSSGGAPPGVLKKEWDYLQKTIALRLEVSS